MRSIVGLYAPVGLALGCGLVGVTGCALDPEVTDERQQTLVTKPAPAAGSGASDSAGVGAMAGSAPIADGQASGASAVSEPVMVVEAPANEGQCGMIEITPIVEFSQGNLLVIFDRSLSMSMLFDMTAATTRLANAKQAITTALMPLVCPDGAVSPDGMACIDTVSVSLLTFPTYDGIGGLNITDMSCHVDGLATPEQINWLGVTEFVRAFEPYWTGRTLVDGAPLFPGLHPLVFGTPISVAFARANEALADPAVVGNKAVLFLTDGEETGGCQDGVDPVHQAQQWFGAGIQTHVVSVAPDLGFGQMLNDQVAAAGGTKQSINPTSSAQLTEEISKIVLESRGQLTCQISIDDARLTNPQQACEKGDVFVQSTKVPCDQENRTEGFFVKDETTIEIVGSYCTRLEETMALRAMFPCALLAPQ